VIPVGLNPDGTVGVPPLDDGAPVGWYRYLAAPGDAGPAVLLGHVDTYRGPAVFYRIHELRPGDAIHIQRADGRSVEFTVDSVRAYPKAQFPAQAVYGPSAEPVLRLVTCGGTFDRKRRTYLSNVVVYASLVTPVAGQPGSRAAALGDNGVTREPETGRVARWTSLSPDSRSWASAPGRHDRT
jgi:hypothetical protein